MKQRVLLIGASGTLGNAIRSKLSGHDVITAGRNSGDINIDITNTSSIISGIKTAGKLTAVICAAGHVTFAPLADFKAAPVGESLHTKGIVDKLMGQVNVALAARDVLTAGGSITLTTGILADRFIPQGSSASLVNNAVEGFVRAAATELPKNIRINVVSPSVFEESMDKYGAFFPGFTPVPVAKAAEAFLRSVEGNDTGHVYKVF